MIYKEEDEAIAASIASVKVSFLSISSSLSFLFVDIIRFHPSSVFNLFFVFWYLFFVCISFVFFFCCVTILSLPQNVPNEVIAGHVGIDSALWESLKGTSSALVQENVSLSLFCSDCFSSSPSQSSLISCLLLLCIDNILCACPRQILL